MKIVVIGGTGLIGSKVVTALRSLGHEVVAASPTSGVDSVTGEGLTEAMRGAQVVVDVTDSPSVEDAAALDFFQRSTANLLAAGVDAGVGHHVALSVVGTRRLPDSGYHRAKVTQEDLVKSAQIPYTIVHATQFFEFLQGIADSSGEGDAVRVAPALVQPIAAKDVAAAVTEVALGAPASGTVEVAGPEQFRLDELVQRRLRADGDRRTVTSDPDAPYFGARLGERTLLPTEHARTAPTRFDDWLAEPLEPAVNGRVLRGPSPET